MNMAKGRWWCLLGFIAFSPTYAAEHSYRQNKHELGVCDVANPSGGGKVLISPRTYAISYAAEAGIKNINFATAKITIGQQPKHGHLEPDSDGDWGLAYYLSDENYLGDDSFAVKVEANGYAVTIRYFMAVNDDVPPTYSPVCKSLVWKISSIVDDSLRSS